MTYETSPEQKYTRQRFNALRRGIDWQFTFESWWKVWQDSGKWEQRGNQYGKYCMSRIADKGHYGPDNVEITTLQDNSLESATRRWKGDFWETWKPYPRTNAWEYARQGAAVNRWSPEEQRRQAELVMLAHLN